MTVPPGLLPQDHAREHSSAPYAPQPGHRPTGTRPRPPHAPTTTRTRVVVGIVAGGTALLVGGVVAFAATYLGKHADTYLVDPQDVAGDDWYGDDWASYDEVWSDSPGSGTPDDPWLVGATVYGPEWDVTLGAPRGLLRRPEDSPATTDHRAPRPDTPSGSRGA